MDKQLIFKNYIDGLNSMELKDKDLYQQYAMMKSAKSVLEERIEELNKIIFEEMQKTGERKKTFDYGGFTIVPKEKWSYSDAVKSKENEVKELKKKEQDEGVANMETSEYLLFK